jgi:hypothetical protein
VVTVTHLFLILLALSSHTDWKNLQCTGEFFSGRYVNYAEGFSVGIPLGLKGKRGQADGPERGFSIPLSANCAGVIAFDGEANSLEWTNALAAAAATASYYDAGIVLRRNRTKLGRLPAVGRTIRYPGTSDIDEFVVALRPGGALVYTARLGTTKARYRQDHQRFVKVLRRFRLEPWR